MADQPEALARIRRMAATLLGVKPAELENVSLETAGADPLDMTMLALEIEAEFGISISDVEMLGITSCEDFAQLVEKKVGVGNG